jgi:hypothetical protein
MEWYELFDGPGGPGGQNGLSGIFFRPCGPLGPCGPLKTLFTHFTTGAILSFCFYILLPFFVTNRQWTIKKTCG